jgi:hypothetical protein
MNSQWPPGLTLEVTDPLSTGIGGYETWDNPHAMWRIPWLSTVSAADGKLQPGAAIARSYIWWPEQWACKFCRYHAGKHKSSGTLVASCHDLYLFQAGWWCMRKEFSRTFEELLVNMVIYNLPIFFQFHQPFRS